jgi:hypothetical protein
VEHPIAMQVGMNVYFIHRAHQVSVPSSRRANSNCAPLKPLATAEA